MSAIGVPSGGPSGVETWPAVQPPARTASVAPLASFPHVGATSTGMPRIGSRSRTVIDSAAGEVGRITSKKMSPQSETRCLPWLLAACGLLALAGCGRLSWGPDGMRLAVGSSFQPRPPFEVEEVLVLQPRDRPPEIADLNFLQSRFFAAIDAGLLPRSGAGSLVAWLLISGDGTVGEVRLEQGSGQSSFDAVFREGISTGSFRPALRASADSTELEPVTVWLRYPFSLTWRGRGASVSSIVSTSSP